MKSESREEERCDEDFSMEQCMGSSESVMQAKTKWSEGSCCD